MAKETAVVLCSGGLTSTVVAHAAAQEFNRALLHVNFPHRSAKREATCFDEQVKALSPDKWLTVDMPHFEQIGGNARVSRKMQIEDAMAIGDARSNAHVPGMIGTFIGAAYNWAHTIGASRILVGVVEELGPPAPRLATIYPDYSCEFIELAKQAYEIASPERQFIVEAPLIDLNRTEIVKLGKRLNVPFEWTWSCLSMAEEPCGGCIGCATRNRGFIEAGFPDPVLQGMGAGA